jgi:SpoVK/Ycf46/Vps4 family AAA+-type ATPase
MLFFGKPGTGKTMTAHAIAKQIGKNILNVDIPTFVEHGDAERFLPSLFREARLQNAVLFFDECEQLFGDRMFGNALMTMLLTELERFEGVAILATNAPQVLDPAMDRRILVKVRFPEPDRDARREIWAKHLPSTVPVAADLDLEALADRYELAGGYIKNAVLMAVAEAVHRQSQEITQEHLENAARQQLARPTEENKLAHPKVRLSQVVLAPALEAQVRELIDAARGRRTVLERWGIGAHLNYGKGLTALFHGPPGTGKTLCAEAVAGELNRPLLRASVPALLSKWVGETENRLEALFHEAKAHAAVLLLDEIDSLLFSRASSSHRWEMSTVNALLTLIEQFSGVLVMATNMPQTLDDALARRVTYRLAFALPDAAARERIWRTLLPASVPIDGELELGALARAFELSGGEIKNAVFKAAFRASRSGALSQSLLWSAAEDEHNAGEKRRPSIGFAARSQNERK